jgi:sodium/potassium-transporting ATPase subunit alpha
LGLYLTAYRAFYFGFQRQGIPFSALWLKYGGYDVDPDVFAEALNRAQSICMSSVVRFVKFTKSPLDFFNLVIMQWGNLLASRTRKQSIISQNPLWGETRNLFLFPAMLVALCLAV